ncbi:MAG TPA: hypothetical protein VH280_07675 [Verrucomicrobiae bacterium]|jgi:hypothetical protein|nr:hypothetical protein [Verrucomicrobiae bacterium]
MSGFSEADLDLEKLFLPAWAQEKPDQKRFEHFTGEEREKPSREKRRGGSFEFRGGRDRGAGQKRGPKKEFRRDGRRDEARPARPEPPAPLPDLAVTFLADEKGVEHLGRQIKVTGRAYPLFQIAHLVLQKPERYAVRLVVKKKPDGGVSQPLFLCALDDTPWLSEEEAVAYVLKNQFGTFYQTERTPTDPPKGTYTFVAQCGMSGVVLGPPNYHDYQNQLRKLHAERFSKMPFDAFKSRVKIVKDEAVVKKWIEDHSFKTEYICLNVPEPLKLASFEEVEKHFRSTHKEAIIKSVETMLVDGVKSRNLRSHDLQRLVRVEWERQKHFPLQLATSLSKQFASHGLQFFKVNKTVVHVSVARPQFLDLETTPVSENIKRIVEFINSKPGCSRRKLIGALAPASQPAAPAAPAEGQAQTAPTQADPTPEQTALVADLHWLIHQGHVLEFADGRLETAKKPVPRPPKPEAKPAEAKAEEQAQTEPAAETPAGESTPAEVITNSEPDLEEPKSSLEAPTEVSAAEPAQGEAAEKHGESPGSSLEEVPSSP